MDNQDSQDNKIAVKSAITASNPSFPEQDENGIDISSLRRNLLLTPTQRIEKMQVALKFAREIKRAGERAGLSRRNSRTE